jgi:hypothetical protein
MRLGTASQQPNEKISYTVEYADVLDQDRIANAGAVASPDGLTVTNVGPYDSRVKFWVTGGVDGTTYKITVTMNTNDGRVFQDEILMKIKEL